MDWQDQFIPSTTDERENNSSIVGPSVHLSTCILKLMFMFIGCSTLLELQFCMMTPSWAKAFNHCSWQWFPVARFLASRWYHTSSAISKIYVWLLLDILVRVYHQEFIFWCKRTLSERNSLMDVEIPHQTGSCRKGTLNWPFWAGHPTCNSSGKCQNCSRCGGSTSFQHFFSESVG